MGSRHLLVSVPRTAVAVGEGAAPVSGYTWNQVLRARYGAANVEWVAPKLASEPLTLGLLRTPVGDFEIASGWQGLAARMPKGSAGFDIVTKSHVEGHAAAIMRRQGISEGILYINNPVICGSCTENLSRMLGSGRSLEVVPLGGSSVPFTGVAR